jgi:hypothetical protein
MAKKVSQRQIQAEIKPVNPTNPSFTSFIFPQISGGEITASVEKIYEGGSKSPTVLCAPFEIGDITLTAHYDDGLTETASLAKKLQTMRTLVGRGYYDINVKVYDCDIGVPGTDRVYKNSLLVGLTEPDGDSSSGAPATFAFTFAIQSVSPDASGTSTVGA